MHQTGKWTENKYCSRQQDIYSYSIKFLFLKFNIVSLQGQDAFCLFCVLWEREGDLRLDVASIKSCDFSFVVVHLSSPVT